MNQSLLFSKLEENYHLFLSCQWYSVKKEFANIIVEQVMHYRSEQLKQFSIINAFREFCANYPVDENESDEIDNTINFYKIPEEIHVVIQWILAFHETKFFYNKKDKRYLHEQLNTFLIWFLIHEKQSRHYIIQP